MIAAERWIGNLLRMGVRSAGVIVAAGAVLFLWNHGAETPDDRTFHRQPAELRSITGLLGVIPSLDGRTLIQLGIVILIATPVARVALSAAAFARVGDRRFVCIDAFNLAVLVYSLFADH